MKNLILSLVCIALLSPVNAGEGMWLPIFLKSLNEAEMQELGMKLSAEDIYSVNKGSLKDAIVHFGGFCTSEIISNEGLMLTNHHCGYGQIQSHTSLENNYLKNGFWAKTRADELMNPGLTATLINEIVDVTVEATKGVNDVMSLEQRELIIQANIESLKAKMIMKDHQDVEVRAFFHGNQYFAFITTTYRDVRLVGAPPESIGKFGADTDNWVWPRHTGDFALFRIYAGPDNLPADPSADNIPYTPKHFLPISVDGVEEGDFTMVFGFPGRTQEYLPSPAVEEIMDVLDPAKIEIREKALNILDKYMRKDEDTRIKYASKFARIANYWKKWIGERTGLKKTRAVQKKEKFEKDFISRLRRDSPYHGILKEFDRLYEERAPYALVRDYYNEIAGRNIELMRLTGIADRLVNVYKDKGEEDYNGFKARVVNYLEGFYKDYDAEIDKEVFVALSEHYAASLENKYVPADLMHGRGHIHKNYKFLADDLYSATVFASKEKFMNLLNQSPEVAIQQLEADPAYILGKEWRTIYQKEVEAPYNKANHQIDSLQRIYMKALMETFPDKKFYPDANSTMRITYGQVNGYSPTDAVTYTPVTYLDGVIEKYKPGDYEFDVDQTLLDLYDNKDYGNYADRKNGKMPVCFIGSNHTSGGNSGSPAIDAEGNLIGLNFDRAWEGTMSDINYDPSICRNIMVDVRYILFIVDKYAGAGHLIKEMSLVTPKTKTKLNAKPAQKLGKKRARSR